MHPCIQHALSSNFVFHMHFCIQHAHSYCIMCVTLYLTFRIWMLAWSTHLRHASVVSSVTNNICICISSITFFYLPSLQIIVPLPTFIKPWGRQTIIPVNGFVVYPWFSPSWIYRLVTHSRPLSLLHAWSLSCYVVLGNLSLYWSEPCNNRKHQHSPFSISLFHQHI